jgi:Uma2 family endonuclease
MAGAALRLMEADEFLVWSLDQETRYELVEGVPVEMMTGASGLHDLIVTNIIAALKSQLRGGPCRPTTADIAVRTRIRSVRRPDVTVTCDPPRGDVYEAIEPKLVVEVLSPSNKGVAWDRKMREYRRMTNMDYILLVDSETVAATLYSREGSDWNDVDGETRDDVLEFPKLGCRLTMTDIYDGTGLTPAPVAEGR